MRANLFKDYFCDKSKKSFRRWHNRCLSLSEEILHNRQNKDLSAIISCVNFIRSKWKSITIFYLLTYLLLLFIRPFKDSRAILNNHSVA